LSNLHVVAVRATQGKYDEAELLLRRAVEIKEKWLGDEHPQYATSLNNRGNMLAQQVRAGD
ncbi:unnamed protein product, partial [Hapterophycus canaliculatus]